MEIDYVFLRVWSYDHIHIHFRTYGNKKLYGYDNLDEEVFFSSNLKIDLTKEDVGRIYFIPKTSFFMNNVGVSVGKWQSTMVPKLLKFGKTFFFVVRGKELVALPQQTLVGTNMENFKFSLPGMINDMVSGSIIAAWDYSDIVDGKIVFDWEKRNSGFVPCDHTFEMYDHRLRNLLHQYMSTVLTERMMIYKTYTENGTIVLRTYPDNDFMTMANMDIFSDLIPERYYYISRSETTSFWVTPIEEPDRYNVTVERKRKAIYEFIFGSPEKKAEKLMDSIQNISDTLFSCPVPKQEQQQQRVLSPVGKPKNPNNLKFYRNSITGQVVQYICLAKNVKGDYDIVYKTSVNEYCSCPMMEFYEKIFDNESERLVPKWVIIDRKEEDYNNINKTMSLV